MSKLEEVSVVYRGWAGHFICANRCRFRLNTLVSLGDVKIVVSTVGLMESGRDAEKGFEQIGWQRYFETMAFHADPNSEFLDADVSRQVDFESPWAYDTLDSEAAANAGHVRVVEEIAARLRNGDKFEDDDEPELSCCNVEFDPDIRICPKCKEHY